MPHVEPELVDHLLGQASVADVVVPVARGYYEPLHAAYRTTGIEAIAELIGSGELKIAELYPPMRVREVREEALLRFDPRLRSIVNSNTQIGTGPGREILPGIPASVAGPKSGAPRGTLGLPTRRPRHVGRCR